MSRWPEDITIQHFDDGWHARIGGVEIPDTFESVEAAETAAFKALAQARRSKTPKNHTCEVKTLYTNRR